MAVYQKQTDGERLRRAFEPGAGLRYGLMLGLGFAAGAWGYDAYLLYSASAELYWGKLALGVLVVLPLTLVTAWLAARAFESALIKFILCAGWGILMAFTVAHLPFEGLDGLARLLSGSAPGIPYFPSGSETQFLAGFMGVFGALAGFPFALVQIFAMSRAWDHSSAAAGMTPASFLMLGIGIPFALGLGILFDSLNNSTLRAPFLEINRVIETAERLPPDYDVSKLTQHELIEYMSGAAWRDHFSSRYTLHMAALDPEGYNQATIDAVFDNGFMWRCATGAYGELVAGCYDVGTEYRDATLSYLKSGQAVCEDCGLEVEPAAAAWRRQNASGIQGVSQVTIVHRPAGVMVASAILPGDRKAVCYYWSANPSRLQSCSIE